MLRGPLICARLDVVDDVVATRLFPEPDVVFPATQGDARMMRSILRYGAAGIFMAFLVQRPLLAAVCHDR